MAQLLNAYSATRVRKALLFCSAALRLLSELEVDTSLHAQLRAEIRAACTQYLYRAFDIEDVTLEMFIDLLDKRTSLPQVRRYQHIAD